jgi:FKBP-type peptidyl-prolyl cis-trans isomerase FklB
MNLKLLPFFIVLNHLITGCAGNQLKTAQELELQSELQKSSYAQGVQHMKNLKQYNTPLDQDAFLKGMNDILEKHPIRLSAKELQSGLDWVVIQQLLYNDKIAPINLAKGKTYLAANKQKTGVVTLPSGLQYKVIKKGNGLRKPSLSDTVNVRYRISRINGEELADSQKDSTAPPEVKLINAIKGWQEALLLMAQGDKWQLFIPSDLAYGTTGAPIGKVEPNETLIYDVELMGIK